MRPRLSATAVRAFGRRLRTCCFWLVIGGFAATIAVTYGLPLWYQAHDERIIVITSSTNGSTFSPGDAVVMNQVVDPSQLRVGQVVTFTYVDERTGSPSLLTHRIIGFVSLPETTEDGKPKIDPSSGLGRTIRYIRTQGSGTMAPDAQLTEITKIRGVVLQVRPHWGTWLGWSQTLAGRIVLFVPPLALLLAAEVMSWRRGRTTQGASRTPRPARRKSETGATV